MSSAFSGTPHLDLEHEVVFSRRRLQSRIQAMADDITGHYDGRELTVIGLLNGAVPFVCDLARAIDLTVRLDFLAISRFDGSPGGEARFLKDLDDDIEGRHVLLADNIVDTGLNLHFVCTQLLERQPASLQVAVLLARPELRLARLPVRYTGFEVSEEFLVGYGLDYRGFYRNLPYIARCQVECEEEDRHGRFRMIPLADSA
ncbi:MAG TPA: hypoxanthine phosphoribosyltransferase [Acidobacteriota bacterium]|nr:hypoxanthine phosphoribosyltransferase [Acidobacteriota bacterium]